MLQPYVGVVLRCGVRIFCGHLRRMGSLLYHAMSNSLGCFEFVHAGIFVVTDASGKETWLWCLVVVGSYRVIR